MAGGTVMGGMIGWTDMGYPFHGANAVKAEKVNFLGKSVRSKNNKQSLCTQPPNTKGTENIHQYIPSMATRGKLPYLGDNIKYYRTAKGLSQAELGTKIGRTQQVVFAYESGDAMPSLTVLLKIAKVLGITVEDLVRDPAKAEKERIASNPRLLRKLRLVEKLPPQVQKTIVSMIDELARAHNVSED
jgi:putative transcriptional regulator